MTTEAAAAPPPCPTCRSVRVVPLAFGFPGAEMWEAARAGTIRLGGCVIGPVEGRADRWACRG